MWLNPFDLGALIIEKFAKLIRIMNRSGYFNRAYSIVIEVAQFVAEFGNHVLKLTFRHPLLAGEGII